MYSTIIDISWPLSEGMTCYKDRASFHITPVKNFVADGVRETHLSLGAHVGTHIDAPAHFLYDGDMIDQVSLQQFIGTCKVVDLMHITEKITQHDLQRYEINRGDIILLKTQNSMQDPMAPFDYSFVYLAQSGADYITKCGIKSIGIDYLGIERDQPQHETHTLLMHAGVGIIEGLRLAHVPAGTYTLVVLPLALIRTEAAPARAILMR